MEVVHKLGLELRFDHIKKFNNLPRVLVKPSLSSNPTRLGSNVIINKLELDRARTRPSFKRPELEHAFVLIRIS
jgi:hypothetical protein